MPLRDFFEKQFTQLRRFMGEPSASLLYVYVDPDIKELFMKGLARLDQQDDNPHIVFPVMDPFEDPDRYFSELLRKVSDQIEPCRTDLAEAGVDLEFQTFSAEDVSPRRAFVRYFRDLAESMPDHIGSVVLLIDAPQVHNVRGYQESLLYLADRTRSEWAKYIVIDDRMTPLLQGLDRLSDRISVQTFYMSPEQIEQQAERDLEDPRRLSPRERRQYMGLLAGFAFARGDYERAARLHQQTLHLLDEEGTPAEAANVLYNLGNARLGMGSLREAEQCFGECIQICLDEEAHGLAAMGLNNLGVTLHRLGRLEESLRSFDLARRTFHTQKNLAGEVHVLDSMAQVYQASRHNREAEQCWNDALAIYDSMTSEGMKPVRESGQSDILAKLEQHFKKTGQPEKVRSLRNRRNGAA